MKPHEYQQQAIDEIVHKFKHGNKRLLFQLDTGGGKTVVFSFLSKLWREQFNKKVLILCHRAELVEQACQTLTQIGLTYEKIIDKTRRLHHNADVYVAMIETLDNRLKKNKRYLLDVGLVIADECHVQVFEKVYSFFDEAKILGVTATPVLLGRDTYFKCEWCKTEHKELTDCCGIETMEWSRPRTLSQTYEDIVVGPNIEFLIEFGQLVKEVVFTEQFGKIDELKVDSRGEFTNDSQDKVFW